MEKKRTFSREAGRETGERRQSLCTVSKKCGGCQYVDVPYEEQLKKKQRQTEQGQRQIPASAGCFHGLKGPAEIGG